MVLVICLLLTQVFAHVFPLLILVPDPCPVLFLSAFSSPFWASHLAWCMCCFGLVLLGGFYCWEEPWALPLKYVSQHSWDRAEPGYGMALLPLAPFSRLLGTSLPIWPVLLRPHAVLRARTSSGLYLLSLVFPHSFCLGLPLLTVVILCCLKAARCGRQWPLLGGARAAVMLQWHGCCSQADLAFCPLHLLAFSSSTAQFCSVPHCAFLRPSSVISVLVMSVPTLAPFPLPNS